MKIFEDINGKPKFTLIATWIFIGAIVIAIIVARKDIGKAFDQSEFCRKAIAYHEQPLPYYCFGYINNSPPLY
jgi:hypothetical protein